MYIPVCLDINTSIYLYTQPCWTYCLLFVLLIHGCLEWQLLETCAYMYIDQVKKTCCLSITVLCTCINISTHNAERDRVCMCVCMWLRKKERGSRFLTLVSPVALATNIQWGKIRHRRFISNTGPCRIHEARNLKKITHKAYWTTLNMVALPLQQWYYIYRYVVLDPKTLMQDP